MLKLERNKRTFFNAHSILIALFKLPLDEKLFLDDRQMFKCLIYAVGFGSKLLGLILILSVKNLSIFIQSVGRLIFAVFWIQQVIYSLSSWHVWSAYSGWISLGKLWQMLGKFYTSKWYKIRFNRCAAQLEVPLCFKNDLPYSCGSGYIRTILFRR